MSSAMDKIDPHLQEIAKDVARLLKKHAGEPVDFGLVAFDRETCHFITRSRDTGKTVDALNGALKRAQQVHQAACNTPDGVQKH